MSPGIGDDVFYVDALRPGSFEVGFDVTNTGPLAVKVEGLASSDPSLAGLGMGERTLAEPAGSRPYPELVPFEPVTIPPGGSRYLSFRFHLGRTEAGRWAPGSEQIFEGFRLRYRYLGIFEREAWVTAPFTVALVHGPLPPAY